MADYGQLIRNFHFFGRFWPAKKTWVSTRLETIHHHSVAAYSRREINCYTRTNTSSFIRNKPHLHTPCWGICLLFISVPLRVGFASQVTFENGSQLISTKRKTAYCSVAVVWHGIFLFSITIRERRTAVCIGRNSLLYRMCSSRKNPGRVHVTLARQPPSLVQPSRFSDRSCRSLKPVGLDFGACWR